ncbi:MAG: fumarate hydratase, partial [Clostridia bacterium]|nr:fumarate hydratase [Clostridia bacterium]
MREISAEKITETVKKLCIEANCHLTDDIKNCIKYARDSEPWPQAKEILCRIVDNFEISDE